MTNTPLNPDALEVATKAYDLHIAEVVDASDGYKSIIYRHATKDEIASRIVSAYLAAALPVVTGEQINRAGWTCDGIHEPGTYATCEDCREACDDLANFYNQMRSTPNASGPWTYRPEVK